MQSKKTQRTPFNASALNGMAWRLEKALRDNPDLIAFNEDGAHEFYTQLKALFTMAKRVPVVSYRRLQLLGNNIKPGANSFWDDNYQGAFLSMGDIETHVLMEEYTWAQVFVEDDRGDLVEVASYDNAHGDARWWHRPGSEKLINGGAVPTSKLFHLMMGSSPLENTGSMVGSFETLQCAVMRAEEEPAGWANIYHTEPDGSLALTATFSDPLNDTPCRAREVTYHLNGAEVPFVARGAWFVRKSYIEPVEAFAVPAA